MLKIDHSLSLRFAGRLNFWLFISFAAGISAGYYFSSFYLFFTLAILACGLVFIFYKNYKIFISDFILLVFFFLASAAWVISFSVGSLDDFTGAENRVKLEVLSLPQNHKTRNIFSCLIKEINGVRISRGVKVVDYTSGMKYPRSYECWAKLSKQHYKGRDFYRLWVKKDAVVREIEPGIINKGKEKITNYILNVFSANLNYQSGRFLSAVFLGRREVLLAQERDIFVNAGVSHLLAISGMHIGFTALVLFFALGFFNIKFRSRIVISMLFLLGYTLLTGVSASTLRAVIMYFVFAFSFFVKRKVNMFNSLGIAGTVSVLINPFSLFEVGFQLSFLAVFAIILGAKLFPIPLFKGVVLNYIIQIFLCSVFVSVMLTPVISYYFGRVYFLTVIYNVVLVPFFAGILIVNFIFLLLSPFNYIVSSLGEVLNLGVALFINLVKILGSLAGSFFYCTFSLPAVFGYYFIISLILLGRNRLKSVFGRAVGFS